MAHDVQRGKNVYTASSAGVMVPELQNLDFLHDSAVHETWYSCTVNNLMFFHLELIPPTRSVTVKITCDRTAQVTAGFRFHQSHMHLCIGP
jgi:hypothetical protein